MSDLRREAMQHAVAVLAETIGTLDLTASQAEIAKGVLRAGIRKLNLDDSWLKDAKLPPFPGAGESGPTAATFTAAVAETDWSDSDLSYLAVNVLHSRGSLPRKERRDAVSAIRTLQAVIRDARALSSEAPPPGAEGTDAAREHQMTPNPTLKQRRGER